MSKQFENVLAVNKPFISEAAKVLPTDQLIRERFMFYSAMLKGYVSYLQKVENKTKAEVQQLVGVMASNLIEQYQFGSRFSTEITKHINQCFNPPSMGVCQAIMDDAQMDASKFSAMFDELKTNKVFAQFSDRFKMVFLNKHLINK